ncbi:hypothetical protein EJ04DRAFT_523343 [Polyplosphaeria fusca]|uniref:Uncharacterized protein n=1 Tax=Polyplosphaeria fusca TaxID=682080 RepID=A0A9P4R0X3_9PLEO|nr:hypothetical protein EJ04DRAFT_523343 [Polyplosphaeria fusca]
MASRLAVCSGCASGRPASQCPSASPSASPTAPVCPCQEHRKQHVGRAARAWHRRGAISLPALSRRRMLPTDEDDRFGQQNRPSQANSLLCPRRGAEGRSNRGSRRALSPDSTTATAHGENDSTPQASRPSGALILALCPASAHGGHEEPGRPDDIDRARHRVVGESPETLTSPSFDSARRPCSRIALSSHPTTVFQRHAAAPSSCLDLAHSLLRQSHAAPTPKARLRLKHRAAGCDSDEALVSRPIPVGFWNIRGLLKKKPPQPHHTTPHHHLRWCSTGRPELITLLCMSHVWCGLCRRAVKD